MINDLVDDIKDIASIPYIEEDDVVVDGCFSVTPYLTDALIGDSEAVSLANHYAIDIFYNSKAVVMATATNIYRNLLKRRYACEYPDYTYDTNGKVWRSSINVTQLGG